ncbi:MAG TPA: toll/interleukin-1 receptor domain-containing protein, partial [Vicinamibacterales bacterium]|nr:toll/interleukin-1 receptor domain-containing protein [Vicinamibacterales bacterium]
MPDIFISYRHDDDHAAARLAKRLQDVFPIFFDTDLKPGEKINEEAEEALREVRIVLAILGKGWFSERNLTRMREPTDWIHWELLRALKRPEVKLIPVFVDEGISMPTKGQLPEPLHDFLMCKAVALHHETWDEDVSDFMDSLLLQMRMRPAA